MADKLAMEQRRERRRRDAKALRRARRLARMHDTRPIGSPHVSGGLPTLGKGHR
jgi:hypothetical protein